MTAPDRRGLRGPAPSVGDDCAARFSSFEDESRSGTRSRGQAHPTLVCALADVHREKREAEATLAAKQRAIAAYDEVFREVAGIASALLRSAGLVELADRVRPSSRKPGRTDAEPEPAPSPTPGPA